jgi:hypothetical protein
MNEQGCSVREIPLYGARAAGRVALVDDADYDLVMQYRWNVHEVVRAAGGRPSGPYARTNRQINGKRRNLFMHTLITGYAMTDHKNHDGLDNQRSNLRPVSYAQNNRNTRPALGSTSRYLGVSRAWACGKWHAVIRVDGRLRHLGYFAVEEDAADAYDAAALEVSGEFANLNHARVIHSRTHSMGEVAHLSPARR